MKIRKFMIKSKSGRPIGMFAGGLLWSNQQIPGYEMKSYRQHPTEQDAIILEFQECVTHRQEQALFLFRLKDAFKKIYEPMLLPEDFSQVWDDLLIVEM